MTDQAAASSFEKKRQLWLNRAGVIVLVLGVVVAGGVDWVGQARQARAQAAATADGDFQDSSLRVEDSKKTSRDVAMYYGQSGVFVAEWLERWQALEPYESTAILIVVFSTIGALILFVAANFWPQEFK